MKIIFRYDDFSASPQNPFEIDKQVFDLFHLFGIPMIVGVTPYIAKNIRDLHNNIFYSLKEDPHRIKLLQSKLKQGWQLALHGYSHQRTSVQDGTEFANEPKDVQYTKIANGLALLQEVFPDTSTNIFIPPWNSYDARTLPCLTELGFTILCGGNIKHHRIDTEIIFAPSLISMRDFVDYINCCSIDELAWLVGKATLIITLHGYEFIATECVDYVEIDEVRKTLEKVAKAGVITKVLSATDDASTFIVEHRQLFSSELYLLQQSKLPHRRHQLQWLRTLHILAHSRGFRVTAIVISLIFSLIEATYRWIRFRLGILKQLGKQFFTQKIDRAK